jgi:zinc D-Ala-D-Ala carboxypeptidase
MRPAPLQLLNTETVDAIPAVLATARRLAHARSLSASTWLLRRKEDGRYLACVQRVDRHAQLQPLDPALAGMRDAIGDVLDLLGLACSAPVHARGATPLQPVRQRQPPTPRLPVTALHLRLHALGIDPQKYHADSGLSEVAEPRWLALAGHDRYRRPLWLHERAASAWRAMVLAAAADGVVIEAISGFRSHAYQHGIFRRKQARGLHVADILAVNAAPGFSEHHGGCALDLGAPGEPPAEESFEATAAFAWLCRHAAQHGFRMSYPRDNPHGIVYEPWHWCWAGTAGTARAAASH